MRAGVLIIAGPTASGKTDLAIDLAQTFDAEIVGADSRQIYRDMPVGTAAPSPAQLRAVRHHLVGVLDPHERYSAARFSADAIAHIKEIHARGKRAIVVGGTGFYIRTLTGAALLSAAFDQSIRERLVAEARLHDREFLYEWLALRDPERAKALHAADAYRVLRALEIALAPPGAALRDEPLISLVTERIPFLKVFIDIAETELESRIVRRTDAMLAAGLIEEAQQVGGDAIAATAVGYPQALAYVRGWCTYEELRTMLIRVTRRYAKRQHTWFRTEPDMQRLAPARIEQAAREKLGWV